MECFKVPPGCERKFASLTDSQGNLTRKSLMDHYRAKILESMDLHGKRDFYQAAVALRGIAHEAEGFAPLVEPLKGDFEKIRDVAKELSFLKFKKHKQISSEHISQIAAAFRGVISLIRQRDDPGKIDAFIKEISEICGKAFTKYKDPEVQNAILEMLMQKEEIRKMLVKLEKQGYFNKGNEQS